MNDDLRNVSYMSVAPSAGNLFIVSSLKNGFGTILLDRPTRNSTTPLWAYPLDAAEHFDKYGRSGIAFADRHCKSSG